MINSSSKDILSVFKGILVDTHYNYSQNNDEIFELQYDILKHGMVFDERLYKFYSLDDLSVLASDANALYGFDAAKMNSTFWKRFSDVESRSELELRLHQLVHYISTYGRGIVGQEINVSSGYEPESLKNIDLNIRHELVYIAAYTPAEIEQKIKNMLTSGIALKQETIDALINIIRVNNFKIDYVDEISNREFMCILCSKLGLVPKNFDEFVRYLNYEITGNTMLVLKNIDTYEAIDARLNDRWDEDASIKRQAVANAIINYEFTYGIKAIAANIRRYHDFFVLLHKYFGKIREVKRILNRAFKMSKNPSIRHKRNKPVLDNVLSNSVSLGRIRDAASRATIYKLFKVINAMNLEDTTPKLYRIRNGKSYFKTNDKAEKVKQIMIDEIKDRLGDWNNKVFYIPEGVDYALPTSEKTFVGTMPYLSSYEFTGENAVAGVAWEKECDLDLHSRFIDGESIGFNSYHKHGGIVFSGDMTHTNRYHYAAEFLKITQDAFETPALININDFSGGKDAKIDVFVGSARDLDTRSSQGVATQLGDKSFMFKDKMNTRNKNLMVVCPTDNGFKTIFVSFDFGNAIVSVADDASKKLTELLIKQADTAFSLKDLIQLLGGKIITDKSVFDRMQEQADISKLTYAESQDKPTIKVDIKSISKEMRKANFAPLMVMDSGDNDNVKETEYIDLTPSKLTSSSFVDLLATDKKEDATA